MNEGALLRARAEGLAARLPPLLADAEHLANAVQPGIHGRRRVGRGDEFWQFRAAHPGDAARDIDWRRSARSDGHFVRQKEWQAAQTVWLWPDPGQSMRFSSGKDIPEKLHVAHLLTLSVAILLVRGGERVGLLGPEPVPPGAGETQLGRIAHSLQRQGSAQDYSAPDLSPLRAHARVVLISDFMHDMAKLAPEVQRNAARGVRGALLQVLDPQEEAFPFTGRTIFQSVGRTLEHETLKARDLKTRYLERLSTRRLELRELVRASGWYFDHCLSDGALQSPLMWLYRALEPKP